jgi:enediyne polyketide synthase
MYVPDQATADCGQPVAITGAALRFPGASDPWSFHQITVAGRQMFRELALANDDKDPARGAGAWRRPLAALLDDEFRGLGRDDELTGGITERHVLAAETATAALADVPPLGRTLAPGRIGVFFADIPEPGTADVGSWVRRQLRTRAGGDHVAAAAGGREGASHGSRLARATLEDLVLGAADVLGSVHGGVARDGTGRPAGAGPGAGTGAAMYGAVLNGSALSGAAVLPGTAPSGPACSLRAVAAACEALNSGQFDLVLAGGVAKGAGSWTGRRGLAASATAPVRVYDASPTGALPGEGCGVVVLMRAADARAAGVPAYAEIAGWHYAGPAATPRPVLATAYLRAQIDPAEIQLVEGHGAATAADDLAELSALAEILGPRAGDGGRCALGSVAANIGDTRAAAGIAALLKAAFAMTADIIPPATGCVRPNQLLRGAGTPFRLPSAAEQWPQTPVQLAAVNSLGTAPYPDAPRSGPVHVVLRREREAARRPGRRRKTAPPPASASGADGAPAQPAES